MEATNVLQNASVNPQSYRRQNPECCNLPQFTWKITVVKYSVKQVVYSTYSTGYPHQHRTRNGRICPIPQLASSNVLYSRCSWSQEATAPNMPVLCVKSNLNYPWWIFSFKNYFKSLTPTCVCIQEKVSPPKFCIQFIIFSIWATHPVHHKLPYSFPLTLGQLCQPWNLLLWNILNSSLTWYVLGINIFSSFWQFFYIPEYLTFLKERQNNNSFWTA